MIRSANWCAWAKGPQGERAEGLGEFPQQALYNLAERLQLIRGNTNGLKCPGVIRGHAGSSASLPQESPPP